MVLDAAGDLAHRTHVVRAAMRLAAALLMATVSLQPPAVAAPRSALRNAGEGGRTTARHATAAAAERIVVGLEWRHAAELDRLLVDQATPASPHFDRYLTSTEFEARFAPSADDGAAVRTRLLELGFTRIEPSSAGNLISASMNGATARSPFFVPRADLFDGQGAAAEVGGSASERVQLRPPGRGPSLPPQTGSPFQPADIARIYAFDRLYEAGIRGDDRRSSTIAIATAFDLDRAALQRFWEELGIDRSLDSIEVIPVGGDLGLTHPETTVDVEWASSMAPGARVLVYATPDPSAAAFLAVYDRIVRDNRAAVLSTSWGLCERDLPSAMRQQAHAIFQRAAAQGITVVAASGDNGAFDCGPDRPGVNFPASDPYVLAVGGTSLRDDGNGLHESAWQGSGGGPSSAWRAPAWQMADHPNRAMADVAFNADPGSGFLAFVDEGWWNFGGTSVAAPCWAAVVALINQRRAAAGRDTLGLAAPAFCEIAHSPTEALAFRDVMTGNNAGFAAMPGWDFPTGWGTPHAETLAETLAIWDPPMNATGAASQSRLLTPETPASVGVVTARFARRCLTTMLRLRLRAVPAGRYLVEIGDEPVASIDVTAAGAATIELVDVDPRGRTLRIRTGDGAVSFSGTFPSAAPPALNLRVPLMSTGAMSGATGTITYRRSAGRETFSVAVQSVEPGEYTVRVGVQVIGTLSADGGRRSARLRFDSAGAAGVAPGVSPLCQVIAIVSDGVTVLRTRTSALTIEECAAG